jgi:hypothetical protein
MHGIDGDIYVTGYFGDNVDFDPGPGVDDHASNGSGDGFLSRFDSTGLFCWARTWGGNDYEYVYEVDVDSEGDIFLCGLFYGTADFDPGPAIEEHISKGSGDSFLSKFDSSGAFIWVRTWGSAGSDRAYGVEVDSLGKVYVTGFFEQTVDFEPGPGIDEHTSNDFIFPDAYLVKFLPDGNW